MAYRSFKMNLRTHQPYPRFLNESSNGIQNEMDVANHIWNEQRKMANLDMKGKTGGKNYTRKMQNEPSEPPKPSESAII